MIRTEGIVLKEIRYKDTSKIIKVYTKEYGRISIMARGAYRPKSKIMANTQPFSYNEYNLHKGRNFFYLNQGNLLNSFYCIREKMERVAYGCYMLELIEKSLPEEQEHEKIFLLLKKGLMVLEKLDKDFIKFIISYELKFISFLGYKPYLKACVLCENNNMKSIKFSIENGGIICSNCFKKSPFSFAIDEETYKAMNEFLYTTLDKTYKIDLPYNSLYKLHEILVEYILYNIDRKKFNTLNLMSSLMINHRI
ncbi:MAG TPA: DNA repair protein RecO [Tissierellaceae bacterium]|nr:DNA repair protein RecO [Tissierellaceae bacterium]